MDTIKNYLSIFKKHEIYLIDKYREVGDIYTFVFDMKKPISWKAGQHGIFTINHIKVNRPTRAFSIASTPYEGHIKISMKISGNPSDFKKSLLDLELGKKILMRGPIGSLYTQSQKPLLFIAGGIGITPYRALIKERILKSADFSNDIQLLYMDSREEFIYVEELDNASKESSIKIRYIAKRDDLNLEIEKFVEEHRNEAEYFIVGPKTMIKSIEALLRSKEIGKRNIKKDTFIGY
ncbi:FAD-dependent oxidoreductase [Serpentinicella alkaliphila]|uniref:Flavin-dependent oxidoreductase n=1 Tax=Serpentinicella alkaliphila TaxID=1734049 RepID=A0A4R2T7B0_9FIRM|nr:FAD-dependent oxidoreductase [Serpentinicella alkaliphila]QUH25725.1 FAD-dependent oxidoreductase [Serpentinicella alkaliphila]TCP99029.1 flavin-dependent oxidoreductase [Serpentinicella alkaliphila]